MEHINIAVELAEARKAQQLSLQEINQRTNIQLEHLQKLESGCYDFLPPFYVRQIVRKYAECLHLPAETIERYQKELEAYYAATQAIAVATPAESLTAIDRVERLMRWLSPFRLMAMGSILVLLGAGFGIYAYFVAEESEETKVVRRTSASVPAVHSPETSKNALKPKPTLLLPTIDAVAATPVPANAPKLEAPKKLTLVVRAKSDCWVGVVADERKMQEAYLRANESSQFEADSLVKLTIGKAEVAEVWLNGKSIELPKRSGVVSNLRFSLSDVMMRN